jgi:cell wall-associated NlpC family hydrolase
LLVGLSACLTGLALRPLLAKSESVQVYRVQSGDSLAALAKRFGVEESALRAKNGLVVSAECKPGDTLVVPLGAGSSGAKDKQAGSPGAAASSSSSAEALIAEGGDVAGRIRLSRNHQVQAGETLGTIASRYGVSVDQILRGNAFPAGTQLAAGQTLVIPLAEHVVRTTQVSRSLPSRSRPTLAVKPGGKNGLAETPAPQVSPASGPPEASPEPPPNTKPALTAAPAPKKKVIGRLGTIVNPGGLIRRTPSAKGPAAYSTRPGNQLVIGGYWGDWYAVVMMDGSHCWIHRKYVRLDPVDLVEDSTKLRTGGNSAVVQAAMRYYGYPYRYGGNGPSGIDCSALVRTAYAAVGQGLPRTAAAQFGVGYAVEPSQLAVGDRLYFSAGGSRIDHCGIYLGSGQMIHASGSAGAVVIGNLFDAKNWATFRGARR